MNKRIKLDPRALSYGDDNWGFCFSCKKQQEVSNVCEGCGKDHVMSLTIIKLIGESLLEVTHHDNKKVHTN
jgi:hypothetical protein